MRQVENAGMVLQHGYRDRIEVRKARTGRKYRIRAAEIVAAEPAPATGSRVMTARSTASSAPVAAPKLSIRAARIDLVAADRALIITAGIVVSGEEFPEIVMWRGDPYLRDRVLGPLIYRRVRPYHLDAGE